MTTKPLTPRQTEALEIYRGLVNQLGYLPSNREFQEASGYASSSSAASMLRQLQKAGYPCYTRMKGTVQTAEDLSAGYAYWVQEQAPRIIHAQEMAARRIAELEEQLERAYAEISLLKHELAQRRPA